MTCEDLLKALREGYGEMDPQLVDMKPASNCLAYLRQAFGAYTGGLNVRDRAFANVFTTLAFTAHMMGERRLYAVAARQCLPD